MAAANPAGRIAFATTQKGIAAGVIVERGPARTTVVTAAGREVWGNDRVFYLSDSRAPLHSAKAAADVLQDFVERVEEARATVDLKTLWDVLSGDGKRHGIVDLADLVFADARPEHRAAAACALALDDTWFRRAGDDAWEPYPAEEVEGALRRRAREAQEREQVERASARIADVLEAGQPYDPADAAARAGVGWLKTLAVDGPDGKDGERGVAVLAALHGGEVSDPSTHAFRALVRLGVFDEDEILAVHRQRIRRDFPAEVREEAGRLAAAALDPVESARDTLAWPAGGEGPVAIDDPWTTEVDDALMVEPAGDATRVHVLIADPTARIAHGTLTDDEGSARAATLYLPTGKVPMFPEILSQGVLSLAAGEVRPMMDFECVLAADGTVCDFAIRPVFATLAHRLTYQEVDALVADPAVGGATGDAVRRLHVLGTALRQRRVEAGAILVERDEVIVRVEGGQVVLRRAPWDSPGRRLVAEFMVLACTQAGAFARANGVPIVYRKQNPPDDRNATAGLKPGTRAWAYRMVRSLRRAELTTHAEFHWGLGVIGYTQVTSPLRRYQDFVTHLQIKGFLRTGRAPLDAEGVLRVFGDLETRGDAVTQAEREGKRYFLLKALKQRENGDAAGEVVASMGSRGIVQLEEFGLDLPVAGAGHLPPGTRVEVRVREVDPRRDRVTLTLG